MKKILKKLVVCAVGIMIAAFNITGVCAAQNETYLETNSVYTNGSGWDIATFVTDTRIKNDKICIGFDWKQDTATANARIGLLYNKAIGNDNQNLLFGVATVDGDAINVKYHKTNSNTYAGDSDIFTLTAGVWGHFDILLDFNEKTIDYYFDGNRLGTATMAERIANDGFYGLVMAAHQVVDNVVIMDDDEMIIPRVTEYNSTDKSISVDFQIPISETDVNDIMIGAHNDANADINIPTVASVEKLDAQADIARKWKITYTDDFTDGYEYYLALPNAIGENFGKKLVEDKLYFTISGSEAVCTVEPITVTDMYGEMTGVSTANDAVDKISVTFKDVPTPEMVGEIKLYIDGIEIIPDNTDLNDKTYTMTFNSLLGEKKDCTLVLPSEICGENSVRKFTTGVGRFDVADFEFKTSSKATAENKESADSLKLDIVNTNRSEKNIYLIYCAYDSKGKMIEYEADNVDVSGNRNEVAIETSGAEEASMIKGFLFEETVNENGDYVRSAFSLPVTLPMPLTLNTEAEKFNIATGNENGQFIISGVAIPNEQVVIQLFGEGDTDYLKTSLKDISKSDIAFTDQTTADATGAYRFDLSVAGKSDKYLIYVFSNGVLLDSGEFSYSDETQFKTVISDLTAIAQDDDPIKTDEEKISDIKNMIEAEKKNLGLSTPLYNNLADTQKVEFAKMLYANGLKDGTISTLANSEISKAKTHVYTCAAVVSLNNGGISNIFDFSLELDLPGSVIKEWYGNTIVTETIQRAITSRLSGKACADSVTFEDMFLEALILEIIKTPDGWGNVQKVIEDYSEFIGIDLTKGSESVYRSLMGKTFENKAELLKEFNLAAASATKPSRPNSSGGGGGGGGGSRLPYEFDDEIIQTPVPIPETTEDISEQPVLFTDCDNIPWAKAAIDELVARGVVSGRNRWEFAPNDAITREEFVKILCLVFEIDKSTYDVPFKDVKSEDWSYPYIVAAFENNIVSGVSKTEFGVGKQISRQDICVMLYNALYEKEIELKRVNPKQKFNDFNRISAYAQEAVEVMQTAGIVKGFDNQEFRPEAGASRAEAVVMLYRLLPTVDMALD